MAASVAAALRNPRRRHLSFAKTQRNEPRVWPRLSLPRFSLPGISVALFLILPLAGGIVAFSGPDRAEDVAREVRGLAMRVVSSLDMMETASASTERAGMAGSGALLTDFAAANEAGLVALRGYLITGSAGFLAEWQQANGRLDEIAAALDRNSRSWSDGARLRRLADLLRTTSDIEAQQRLVAGLVGTPNRFPGLRLYDEDIDPALEQAMSLCDEALRSIILSRWPGMEGSVDSLARLRGALLTLRPELRSYLVSGDGEALGALQTDYATMRAAPSMLAALRAKVSPEDQRRIDRIAALIAASDMPLQRVMTLRRSPRWDYADYGFRQKVLPLAEAISSIVDGWRTAG